MLVDGLMDFFSFLVFEIWSHYIAQTSMELRPFLLYLPSAGIIDINHHAWLGFLKI
jgi:hypothetical protein